MIGDHTGEVSRPCHEESVYEPFLKMIGGMDTEARLKTTEIISATIGAIAMLAGFEQDHNALIAGGLVGVVLSTLSAVLRKFH